MDAKLLEWSFLPSTVAAVWLPVFTSAGVIWMRYQQKVQMTWWAVCLCLGILLGSLLAEWVPGSGLHILPGFLVVYMAWLLFFSKTPHRIPQLRRATEKTRNRYFEITDPWLIATGSFLSTLAVDVYYAMTLGASGVSGWGDHWYYGVGGAGMGDGLFGALVVVFIVFKCAQVFTASKTSHL